VNFGPGSPSQAHRRDESILVDNLVRAYRVLEAWNG
jgi:acetylornithine deacetylase/succinyl-diaminopimelate desuccinylase-like protein